MVLSCAPRWLESWIRVSTVVACAVASCGWNWQRRRMFTEFVTAKRLQEWPLACQTTVPRVFLGFQFPNINVSSSVKDPFVPAPACVALTIPTLCRQIMTNVKCPHGRQNRNVSRRFVREGVRIWWQYRGFESLCLPNCTIVFML